MKKIKDNVEEKNRYKTIYHNIGRHYIGFEIEPKWFKIAQDRLNFTTANGQMSLFLT